MPERPPKAWFERCVESVEGADDPKALCGWVWHHHMSPKRKAEVMKGAAYDPDKDLPPSKDFRFRCDVLLRAVPEVDDLIEVALYPSVGQYHSITKLLASLKALERGRYSIIRRGKANPATNIFIYG